MPSTDTAEATGSRRLTWESLATGVMCLGLGFAATPSLKVVNPPLVTYSDVFLFLGLVMLMPRLLRGRISASPLYLVGALMLFCVAVLSFVLVPQAGQVQGVFRITYALIVMPLAFVLWRPAQARVTLLAASYVLGTCVSVAYGVVNGPGPDGRNLGLTFHPNGLGHTALMAIALLPYLAAVRPSARWLLVGAALVCSYGIWISGSRGSLIGLVLTALVYVLVERSATAALFAWGGAIVLVMAWPRLSAENSNNVLSRVIGGGSSGDANGQRLEALHEALDQIQAHPFRGNGFLTIRAAQNAYLQITAALGIFGLVALLLILAALVLPLLTGRDPLRLLCYLAAGYILLAPFTDSLSDTLIWAPLSMCVVARPGTKAEREDQREAEAGGPRLRGPRISRASRPATLRAGAS